MERSDSINAIKANAAPISMAGGTNSRLNIGGALVERVLEQSLPEMVSEVERQDHYQTEELEQLRQGMKSAIEELQSERQKEMKSEQEMKSITRQVYLRQDDLSSLEENITNIQKEIENIIHHNCELEMSVLDTSRALDAEVATLSRCTDSMLRYQEAVESEERATHIQQAVDDRMRTANDLQNTVLTLKKGGHADIGPEVYKKKIRTACGDLEKKETEMQSRVNTIRDQIVKEKEAQRNIEKSISVLHRRNSAQLVRLQRQVEEARVQDRHWAERRHALLQQRSRDNYSAVATRTDT